jgi:hypothetical protein
MSILVAWVAFPLVLGALAVGCGLLLERLVGARLPGSLIAGSGVAVIVVTAQLATLTPATAGLATPLALALAAAGFGLTGMTRLRDVDRWGAIAAAGVFAVYAAPVLASGSATFAGYIRLDDTATWMALTDRIMEHGRSLEGLAPSTYEATLTFNLGDGYPIGAFLFLGVGQALVGQDVAWLVQPYMAVFAVLLALAIWSLASPLVGDPRLRAGVTFIAAQPALLFGYSLWGGIKEVAATALIATVGALLAVTLRERFSSRSLLPVAVVCAAVIASLSPGGAIWLAPALLALLALGLRELGVGKLALRATAPLALAAALCVPALVSGLLPPTSSPLTDASAQGSLLGPLHPAQIAGIWPAGDFRLSPEAGAVTAILIAVVVAAACAGAVLAWRRRAWPLLTFGGGSLVAGFTLLAAGSPWVAGKALAIGSAAIPLLAAIAVATLISSRWRIEGAALAALLALAVLWSNALAYRDVNLAPRDQLAELEEIGAEIAGQGPTLLTEYQPYGARHFLRHADPESASELRRRTVPLRGGGTVRKGGWADTDELDLRGLLAYRTLVLRRNPSQSRPPSPYELARSGRYYYVWQRPEGGGGEIVARLPLGDGVDPAGRPSCDRVLALAERVGGEGTLLAARARRSLVLPLGPADYPTEWPRASAAPSPPARTSGAIRRTVRVPEADEYEIWLGGSVRLRVELWIDGRRVGAVRHELNNFGQYVRLGAADLDRGPRRVEVRFGSADAHPGSGGSPSPVGPLVLAPAGDAADGVVRVDAADAAQLCGRRWDWIEAIL